MTILSRHRVIPRRFRQIGGHADAVLISRRQQVLSRVAAMLRRGVIEPSRLDEVSFDPFAPDVQDPQIRFGVSESLSSRPTVPLRRACCITGHTSPLVIQHSEVELCVCLPLFCGAAGPYCSFNRICVSANGLVERQTQVELRHRVATLRGGPSLVQVKTHESIFEFQPNCHETFHDRPYRRNPGIRNLVPTQSSALALARSRRLCDASIEPAALNCAPTITLATACTLNVCQLVFSCATDGLGEKQGRTTLTAQRPAA